jgi:regulatory protein
MRSRQELTLALRKKRFAASVVDEVLDALTRVGLVNDVAFAEGFARGRATARPRSERLLVRELRAKGVSEGDVRAALERLRAEAVLPDDEALARRALAKRARSLGRLPAEERRRKAAAFLRSRGFSFDTIRAVTGAEDDLPGSDA